MLILLSALSVGPLRQAPRGVL